MKKVEISLELLKQIEAILDKLVFSSSDVVEQIEDELSVNYGSILQTREELTIALYEYKGEEDE